MKEEGKVIIMGWAYHWKKIGDRIKLVKKEKIKPEKE